MQIYKDFADATARVLTAFVNDYARHVAQASKRIKADDRRVDVVRLRGLVAAIFESSADSAAIKKDLKQGRPQ